MKAGGVKFADTPEEAEAHAARRSSQLEINGHMPRGVLVDPKAEVKQEYYAGVVWDGIAQAAGDDLLATWAASTSRRSPSSTPTTSAARHFSNLHAAQRLPGQGGHRLDRRDRHATCNKLVADPRRGWRKLFVENDMTLAEINPLGELEDGTLRRARRAHGHGERGPRRARRRCSKELGVGDEETREAREATPFELAGEAVDAHGPPRRRRQRHRVRRQPRPRDRRRRRLADAVRRGPQARRQARQLLRDRRQPVGREGLRPGQARPAEAGRRQDRRDDVDRLEHARRHRRPRRDQGAASSSGYDPAEKIAIFRIPGAWEDEGFKILEKYGVEYSDRSVSLHEAARRAVEKIGAAA